MKEEKKIVTDPFATELFGDISNFGAPRLGKITKNSFPQQIKPKIGDLRGEPSTITPATTTVDPFFISPSNMGLSVSVSPPDHSSTMDSAISSTAQHAMMMHHPHNQVRRVSTTSGNFSTGQYGSSVSSPPVLPPRPLAHSNSTGTFAAGGLPPPPPTAPRRISHGTHPGQAFAGTSQLICLYVCPSIYLLVDLFSIRLSAVCLSNRSIFYWPCI